MKWLNLTFEQSDKLTKDKRKELRYIIRSSKSIKNKFFKDGLLYSLLGLFFAFLSWAVSINLKSAPYFILKFTSFISSFILFELAVFIFIFFFLSLSNNLIVESIAVQFQGFFSMICVCVTIVNLMFVLDDVLNFTVYVCGQVISVLLFVQSISAVLNRYNKCNYDLFGETTFWIEKVSKIGKSIKIITYVFLAIYLSISIYYFFQDKLFIGIRELSYVKMLEVFISFIILLPFTAYGITRLLFEYEIFDELLPLYYLKKYQSEYEAKYKMDFGGNKKK